jgi:PAS domain-containing protein
VISSYPLKRTGLGRSVADIVGSTEGGTAANDRFRLPVRPAVVPLDVVPFPMLVADGIGRVLAVNSLWVEVSGLSCEDSLGLGWLGLLDAEDRRAMQAELALVAATASPARLELGWSERDGHRSAWWLAPREHPGEHLIGIAVGEPLAVHPPAGEVDRLVLEVPALLRSIDALLATIDRLADRLPVLEALPA